MANGKIGQRGTSSYAVTGERPESWREGIMYLFPNPTAALTAIMSGMKGKKLTDAHFHWFTEKYINKAADLSGSGVYTDAAFGTALSATTSAAGSLLAARCTAAFTTYLKEGHMVLLRTALDHSGDMMARVESVIRGDDTTSGFTFVTMALDGSSSTATLVTANRVLIAGSAHAEGSNRPESVSYVPTEHSNYTQIFRTSLNLTRTAMRTKLRTQDAYDKAKKQCMEDHTIEMEDAFIWGQKTLGTDVNSGEPIRTTRGIVPFIREFASDNVLDYRLDADYSGQTWDAGGEEFMYDAIQQSFLWGDSTEKLCLTGAGGMKAIQRMVKNNAMYTIKGGETAYGLKVRKLETPFGDWNIRMHPRFTHESSNTNSMLVLEPKHMQYNYIDDTSFEPDIHFGKGGGSGKDGKVEGFLTECGLELYHPETFMYISNLGVTNVA